MRLVLVSFSLISFFLPSFLFLFFVILFHFILFYFILFFFLGGGRGGLTQNLAWSAASIPCMPLQLQQAIRQVRQVRVFVLV